MPEITIEITWHQYEALQAIAEREEVNLGELIRWALDEFTVVEQQRQQWTLNDQGRELRDFGEGPEETRSLDI